MSFYRLALSAIAACLLASCSTAKPEAPSLKSAYVAPASKPVAKPLDADDPVPMAPAAWFKPNRPLGGLGGRTLTVGSVDEIKLRPKEVILTFDDGPMPGKTEAVLAILNRYGVKASFMMVGSMAEAHPAIARKVAGSGNSIGSHTFRHADLAHLSFDQAMNEILKGETAVRTATGVQPGFFRFPYLSDTRRLRLALASRGSVVMDVQIDSKDYFRNSPSQLVERTMASLHKQGHGIILMHDIHARTVQMLPTLLERLKAEGYQVVALRYKRSRMPLAAGSV